MMFIGFLFVIGALWLWIRKRDDKWFKVLAILWAVTGLIIIGFTHADNVDKQREAIAGANDYQLGRTFNKSVFKSHDDLYYTVKNTNLSNEVRYFVSNNKVTAAKIVTTANPINGMLVQDDLEKMLKDKHLKYTDDKLSEEQFMLDEETDTINVYSPKHKKWFHFHGQTNDDGLYTSVSVFPGKSDN